MSAMTTESGGFVSKRGVHVHTRRQKRRRKAKQDASQRCHRDRKTERAGVGVEIELDRDFSLRQQRQEQACPPISKEQSEQGSKTAEQNALDKQLPDKAQTAHAQSQSDRDLFTPRDG